MQVAELFRPVLGDEAPVAIRAYDGDASTPSAAEPVAPVAVRSETARAYLAASPNSLGLARAYVREIRSLNTDMAGEPGWEPMPERMEQLRRAIELVPAGLPGVTVLRRAVVPPFAPDPV